MNRKYSSDDFVVTKSSLVKKNSVENFECVVYESHKSKKQSDDDIDRMVGKPGNEKLDLKKMHHEIFKFAVKGMTPEQKREANMKLAIKLGARPPKKECINYKTLKMQKEIEKKKQNNVAPDDPLAEVLRGNKKHKRKERRGEKIMHNILEGYGKPGQVKRKKKKKKK